MSKIKTSFNNTEEKTARLAVLIDADNASARSIEAILQETTKFGEATVKRIYGNFVGANNQWKDVINEYAIKPMQQFAFTTGKNATDGFMIIDAMDLLYTNRFDGFCIVSSDSDFTALAIRLKEQGATVYGFGQKQTPAAFRNACTHFIYVENLLPDDEHLVNQSESASPPVQEKTVDCVNPQATVPNMQNELPLDILQKIFEQFDDSWITAARLGSQWRSLQVDFDPRSFGYKRLTDLVREYPDVFDFEMRSTGEGTQEHMYVKLKSEK